MTIKAIIFDWGGVLIDHPASGLFTYCAKHLNVSKEDLLNVYKNLEERFQKGLMSEKELWQTICSELGRKPPRSPSLWWAALQTMYHEKTDVFSLVSCLKRNGYRIGLLSNTEQPATVFSQKPSYHMFDVMVFSCIEGTRKPEARMYRIALERLQVLPQEAVFIDDSPECIAGAAEVGLNAILFVSSQQLKSDLSEYAVQMK